MDEDPLGDPRPAPAPREEPRPGRAERPYGPEAHHERPYGPPYYHQPQPPRRGGLRFSYLLLAALLIGALVFAAAPFWAFRSLRSAALYGDTAALAELIDYGAVRASLREQLGSAPGATRPPPPDFLHDPLGALRRRFAEPEPKPADIDAYLSPRALARLSLGMTHEGPAPERKEGPLPALRFWDGERARLGVKDPDRADRETVFTLKRGRGLKWRLVGLALPPAPN
jgi:hypothetical protein